MRWTTVRALNQFILSTSDQPEQNPVVRDEKVVLAGGIDILVASISSGKNLNSI